MSSDFNQLVLREMPDGIVITDPAGIVVHWTKGAEQLFGFASDEAVGRPLIEIIIPADRIEEENRILQETIANGVCYVESLRRTKDGSLIYVDISSEAVLDAQGKLEYILSSKKDVTHLKAMRDAKLLDAKFCDLLESAPNTIVIVDQAGNIVLVNSPAERLFGYRREELPGKKWKSWCRSVIPQVIRSIATDFSTIRARPTVAGLELFGVRRDGSGFPLPMKLPGPLTAEQDKQLRTIQSSVRHLLSLTDDLLDLAKIESGKLSSIPNR